MNKNRIILIISILLISLSCFIYMNLNYDELARNTSITKYNRNLIEEKLNDDQIRYIVENNIDVNTFYRYLSDSSFIFDNYRYYNRAGQIRSASPHKIVTFINSTIDKIDNDDLFEALQYYDYDMLKKIILEHSPYNQNATLVVNPYDLSTYLDISNTIGRFEPNDLDYLSNYSHIIADNTIMLRKEAAESLNNLCKYLEVNTRSKCGSFEITSGYMSYDEVLKAFNESLSMYGPGIAFNAYGWPSHNEHQLGLAVDINYLGTDFMQYSSEYALLRKIASDYGFIFYGNTDLSFPHLMDPTHMRYVGEKIAKECENIYNCIYSGR